MSPPAPASDAAGEDVRYHAISTSSSYDTETSSISTKSTHARRSIMLTIVLPTLFAFLLTAGFGTLFIAWLSAHRSEYHYKNGFLLVNEGTKQDSPNEATLRGLTISSITSSLVSFVNPLVMTLLAYVIALKWLSVNVIGRGPETALPTPLQYGLMVRLLSGESLFALYDSTRYVLRSSRRRALTPHVFQISLLVALISYLLSHAVGASDLWLHITTQAAIFNITTPVSPLPYSLEFNSSYCEKIRTAFSDFSNSEGAPCFIGPGGWGSVTLIKQGLRIISNDSSTVALKTLADANDASILVRRKTRLSTEFRAVTYGARAQCRSINALCALTDSDPTVWSRNCSNIGIPELPFNLADAKINSGPNESIILGDVNGTLVGHAFNLTTLRLHRPSNPVPVRLHLRWSTLLRIGAKINPPSSAVDFYPVPWVNMYVTCDLAYFRAVVRRLARGDSNRYIIESEELIDRNMTAALVTPLLLQLATSRLASNLYAQAITDTSVASVEAGLNQELSRMAIGIIGRAFMFAPTLDQAEIGPAIVGQYPVLPVVAFATSLYLYSALVLIVVVWAIVGFSSSRKANLAPEVESAQLRLSNPMALVAMLFPSAQSVKENGAESGRMGDAVALFDESGMVGKPDRLYLSGRGIYGVQGLEHDEKP